MNERPDWADCIAAQLWCKPQHAHKVMDPSLCADIADALRAELARTKELNQAQAEMIEQSNARNIENLANLMKAKSLLTKAGEALKEIAENARYIGAPVPTLRSIGETALAALALIAGEKEKI